MTADHRRAYAYCERIARDHYENFPVASRLLPAAMRPHIAAIYAFARKADDFADEPGILTAERLQRLDGWADRLHRAADGAANTRQGRRDGDDLIFEALAASVRSHALPVSLFDDLLSAFRQDVTTHRYETWEQVIDYCRRSANPVGRLVLRVAGYTAPTLDEASDAVCTALQLPNFWQDIARDWRAGRLYVPRSELARFGATEDDLDRGHVSPAWRDLVGSICDRTAALFAQGRQVCDAVQGRLRWELRFTWLGGRRILQKVRDARQRSFEERPTLSAGDVPALLRDAMLWPRDLRA